MKRAIRMLLSIGVMLAAVLFFRLPVYADSINVEPNMDLNWGLHGESEYWTGGYPVTIKGRVTVLGNVRLTLASNADLIIEQGITVPVGKTLTIELGSHSKLTANGPKGCAGIGGDKASGSGTIIIEGDNTGTVVATGGEYAAGIGGSDEFSSGPITIKGGKVKATGGDYGAGIGGGYKGTNWHEILITGGEVEAMPGIGGAGIGSGYDADTKAKIRIEGSDKNDRNKCKVTARSKHGKGYHAGAGIGSGYKGDCVSDITIENAVVVSKPDLRGAAIGGGSESSTPTSYAGGDFTGNLTITNAEVEAVGGYLASAIGGGWDGILTGKVTITDSKVTALGGEQGAGIGSGRAAHEIFNSSKSGRVYIHGNSTVLAKSGGNNYAGREFPSSAIGHGYHFTEVGHIYFDPGLCVRAGDYDHNYSRNYTFERTFTAAEREGACMYRNVALIEPCRHENPAYSDITEETHTQKPCPFCGTKFDPVNHTKDASNRCTACGYQDKFYRVTYRNGDTEYAVEKVVPGEEFYLAEPESGIAPAGKVFTGWKKDGDSSGKIYAAGETVSIAGDSTFIAQFETGYDLWVNGVQVREGNKDNLPCDSGTVSYDAGSKTLTLNGATLTERFHLPEPYSQSGKPEYAGIYSKFDELTIKVVNENNITPYSGGATDKVAGIYATGNVTIKTDGQEAGTLNSDGAFAGICAGGKLTLSNVKVTALADITDETPDAGSESSIYGVRAKSIRIDGEKSRLDARGDYPVYYADTDGNALTWDSHLGITEPVGAEVMKEKHAVLKPDGSMPKRVVISVVDYPIWVRGTQLNDLNIPQLLGTGASFDPSSKTLKINDTNVQINDASPVEVKETTISAGIYSELDELTIEVQPGFSLTTNADYGIYTAGDLKFTDSNVTITAGDTAIAAGGDLTAVGSLAVIAEDGTEGGEPCDLVFAEGDILVANNLEGVSVHGSGVYAAGRGEYSDDSGVYSGADVFVSGNLAMAAAEGALLISEGSIEVEGNVTSVYRGQTNSTSTGFDAGDVIIKSGTDKTWDIKAVDIAMMADEIFLAPSDVILKEGPEGERCRLSTDAPVTVVDLYGDDVGSIEIKKDLEDNVNIPSAKTGLIYNGELQELVTPGAQPYGRTRFAIDPGDTVPEDESFAETIPSAKEAGDYKVWYRVKGSENLFDDIVSSIVVSIGKGDYDGQREFFVTVSGEGETVELPLPKLPEGASYGKEIEVSGDAALIQDTPSVSGNILSFRTASQDEAAAAITIPVKGAKNYNDYDVVVNVSVSRGTRTEAGITVMAGDDIITGSTVKAVYGAEELNLSATVDKAGSADQEWKWTSSDNGVATVKAADGGAVISVKGAGRAAVNAEYESDSTAGRAVIYIDVAPKPLTVSWNGLPYEAVSENGISYTYDGTSHIPAAAVNGVVNGDDAKAVVSLNGDGKGIKAGKYIATASLTGNSSGNYALREDQTACSVTVEKKDISGAVVTLGDALTYNGEEQRQTVSSIMLDGTEIRDDCETDSDTGTDAGEYTLVVTPMRKSNYSGQVYENFTIAKKAITPVVEIMAGFDLTYTGEGVNPGYTVKDGEDLLSWMDYSGEFSNNINAGEALLTVTESEEGNYTFSAVKKTFTIEKAEYTGVKEAEISVRSIGESIFLDLPGLPQGAAYAGNEISISGEKALISGTPSVTGTILSLQTTGQADNTVARITIPVKGAVNYTDYEVTVTVTAKDREAAAVTIYSGEEAVDSKTVTYGSADFELKALAEPSGENGVWRWTVAGGDAAQIIRGGDSEEPRVRVLKAGTATITVHYESDTTMGNARILLAVEKKPVTVSSIIAEDREYRREDRTVALKGVLSGVINEDDVTAEAIGTMDDANAGESKKVKAGAFALTGADAGNYILTQQSSEATVNITRAVYGGSTSYEKNRSFLYSEEAEDSVELSDCVPSDSGGAEYTISSKEGGLVYKKEPVIEGNALNYTLKPGSGEESGVITVKAQMRNYSNEITVKVIVRQEAIGLYEKAGKDYVASSARDLAINKSFTLVARFDDRIVNKRVVWKSSNPGVAMVAQNGKVTGKCGGLTTISAISEEQPDKLIATCDVSVMEPVTGVILDKKSYSFGKGEKVTLSASILPNTGLQRLIWTPDNANVKLEVAYDTLSAEVTGVSEGRTKITVTAADGSKKKAVCSLKVGEAVQNFSVAGKGNATEVTAGKNLAMNAVWPGRPANKNVIWSVESAEGEDAACIAAISDKGVLTGIMPGKVTVTAVSVVNPDISASTVITVKAGEYKGAEIKSISFDNKELLAQGLSSGKSVTLKTDTQVSGTGKAGSDAIAWYSSDTRVATVTQKGVVKAMEPGEVTITALYRYAEDVSASPKDSVTFKVNALVKSLKPDKKKLAVCTQEGGSQYGIVSIAEVLPSYVSDPSVSWTVNNENVQLGVLDAYLGESYAKAGAGVTTKSGERLIVKAAKPGSAKITGTTTDGSKKRVSCTVTVRGEVTGLKLKTSSGRNGYNDVTEDKGSSTDSINVYTGKMKPKSSLALKPLPEVNGVSGAENSGVYNTYRKFTDVSVSYRSSDTSVATVTNSGKVVVDQAARNGSTATIYVESADGAEIAEYRITVSQ